MKRIFLTAGVCIAALVIAQAGGQKEQPVPNGTGATNWVPVGPEGGDVQGLAVHPTNASEITAVISGYPSSIYRTMNRGQSWERVALINDRLHDLDYDPLNAAIQYAAGNARLWKSTDGGGSWSSSPFPSSASLTGNLAVHPSSPNILYGCGISGSGSSACVAFLKSTDSGATWTTRDVSLSGPSAEADRLAVSPAGPNTIYLSGSYVAEKRWVGKLYRSSDGGASWNDVTPPVGSYLISGLAVDPTNADKVYAGTIWSVFWSVNGGATWTKNGGQAFSYALAVDPNNPDIIYAGHFKAVYKSRNGGANWTKSVGMLGSCATILASNGLVYFGSGAGVYRSLDAASSWQEANSGIKASNIVAVTASAASPNIVYGEMSDFALYRSLNFGVSWSRCPDFDRCDSISRILTSPTKPNEVLALVTGSGG